MTAIIDKDDCRHFLTNSSLWDCDNPEVDHVNAGRNNHAAKQFIFQIFNK
jgi:hypothetical protein